MVRRTWAGPIEAELVEFAVAFRLVKGGFELMLENQRPLFVNDCRAAAHRFVPLIVMTALPPCGTMFGTMEDIVGAALGHIDSVDDIGTHSELSVFRIAVKVYLPSAVTELVQILTYPDELPS